MKKKSFPFFLKLMVASFAIFLAISMYSSCQIEVSEGLKFGTLQKVSHKQIPCEYFVAEFAYEGGVMETSGTGKNETSTHVNTQEVEITKTAYDSLQMYLGDKVIFEYEDGGISACGRGKKLKSIKRKATQ